MGNEVRFGILGPLSVTVDGSPIVVSAARQRSLLARLLLDANRSMHPDVLIDAIWGPVIPQHPDAALQIIVSRLRSALGHSASRLTSGPAGYCIEASDDEVDHLRARRTFSRARELWEQNDFVGAAAAAETALSCWTGDALADLADAPFYDAASAELRELRLAVYELRNQAYFRCGRHVEIIADIAPWIRSEPWRERLRSQHMLALYRTGRRVEALAAFEDLRGRLYDDLGVEPSSSVLDLYLRMREQDPTLVAHRAGIVAALPSWTVCTMPFVGRGREESQIFDRLQEVAGGGRHMILVEGESGIGKSRLVLEAARRAHDEVIVLPVDGADAVRPGLQVIAGALADASSHLGDAELRLCLGRWPGDLAEMVPSLRTRLPDLPPALAADDESRTARRRAAVVSWISGLSHRAPVLLLIDDLHRAGPALLVFLGALLADTEPKRVLVLATARSAADRSARLEQLVRRLDEEGLLDRLELTGLTLSSVDRLLSDLGRPDSSSKAAELVHLTHGHPLLLGEMLRDADGAPSPPTATDVTVGIRHFVLQRVAALGDPGARLLGIAAAVDGNFELALLTELSRGTAGSTETLVDRAIEAGLVHVTGIGLFDFVHDLARRVVVESIDPETRDRLHRDIATAFERRDVAPALVATQWNRVSGPDADARTIEWAERAGEAALRDLDPYAAAGWFALAAERAADEPTRAHLLIRLAGAQCQAGEREGADTLRAALEIARRLDDGKLLVEAATVWTPIWESMPTLTRSERVDVLREGAKRVPAGAVRAQLLARLATELSNASQWSRARDLAAEALGEARRGGNRAVVPEVCMRHFQVTGSPHSLEERRRYMRDVVEMTADGRDPIQRFFALGLAACAAIEVAEVVEADRHLDDAFAIAREAGVPALVYNAECMRAWRTGLAGDLDEAERLAFAAIKFGRRSRIDYAMIGPGLQLSGMRWQLGRFAELVPLLRLTAAGTDDVGVSILLARALASTDETRAEASEVLAKAAGHEFDDLPLGLHWAGSLVAAAEAACMLGNASVAKTVRILLEPFVERVAFNGVWTIAPIAYGAAVAAAAAGESACHDLFREALGVCDRLRAPMLKARTELAWSQVLDAGDGPGLFVEHPVDPGVGSADAFYRRASDALGASVGRHSERLRPAAGRTRGRVSNLPGS